jgi:hypothetical protein
MTQMRRDAQLEDNKLDRGALTTNQEQTGAAVPLVARCRRQGIVHYQTAMTASVRSLTVVSALTPLIVRHSLVLTCPAVAADINVVHRIALPTGSD